MESIINQYCARIGSDPSMVQGAGGNVSWKEGDTLFVKASGTWLADADQKNIFVAVNLGEFRAQLAKGYFEAIPPVLDQSGLRPSIETVLHAVLPQRLVVHTHPVNALAYLVRKDCAELLQKKLGETVQWILVDYHKPGPELGAAVYRVVKQKRNSPPEVVFLANHGVIVAADSLDAVERIYVLLNEKLAVKPRDFKALHVPGHAGFMLERGYNYLDDDLVQRLAFDPVSRSILTKHWALYPDHVVFLGGAPEYFETPEQFKTAAAQSDQLPDYAILSECGTFVRPDINQNKMSMLKCYGEVVARLDNIQVIKSLSQSDIMQLLDWEAEKYRSRIAK